MRAVLFDIGNVMLHWRPQELLGPILPEEAMLDARLQELGFAIWYGDRTDRRPWESRLEEMDDGDPRREVFAAYLTGFHRAVRRPVEGSAELLEDLVAAGVPVFAVTNAPPEADEIVPREHGFMTRFVDVAVSSLEGVRKPDPEIFRRIMVRNGLTPEACLFTDDGVAYLEGARAIGMKVHHFDGAAGLRQRLVAEGFLR